MYNASAIYNSNRLETSFQEWSVIIISNSHVSLRSKRIRRHSSLALLENVFLIYTMILRYASLLTVLETFRRGRACCNYTHERQVNCTSSAGLRDGIYEENESITTEGLANKIRDYMCRCREPPGTGIDTLNVIAAGRAPTQSYIEAEANDDNWQFISRYIIWKISRTDDVTRSLIIVCNLIGNSDQFQHHSRK